MSSTTPNLGLTKTTAAETIGQNWAASNESGGNFDIIDTKMGAVGNQSVQAQLNALNSNKANNGYVQKLSTTEYAIPIAQLQANHSYGIALVAAYTSLFALFFINNNTATITKLSGNLTASITNKTETEITITFSNTVWDGITVRPL